MNMLATIKKKLAQTLLLIELTSPLTINGDIIQQYSKEAYYAIYATANFNRVLSEQEEKFKIKHPKIPNLRFRLSGNYYPGIYDYKTNTIFINLNKLEKINTTNQIIDDYLAHELGHSITSEACKNIGNRVITFDTPDYGTRISRGLIKEGISEYYKLHYHYERSLDSLLVSDEFPRTVGEWKAMNHRNFEARDFYLYTGGYALVKPIIDEFGTKGIEYLVVNPPTIEELGNLKKYQTNILNRLRNII